MRQPILTASLLVAACGLLTACDLFSSEPDDSDIDESNVSGEVLEGTISDDMIPLDQLRSTAPHAQIVPEGGASTSVGADAEPDAASDVVTDAADESPAGEVAEPADSDEATD